MVTERHSRSEIRSLLVPGFENTQKRLLRDFDLAKLLHAFLTLFLL